MTTLNLRLKLTRVNALKLKVLPRFPASIRAEKFLTVTSANSTYTFDVDYTLLSPGPVVDPTTAYVAVQDQSAGLYKIVSLASLLVSGLDADLQAIGALTGTGILSRTADGTWALRSMVAPAAGLTITNPAGIAGNEIFALANDLAALEALASTGFAVRSAADTWVQRVIAGTANEITLTNGDGISGNPTASLPAALTFTGKTVTGGTFNSPALVTPALGTPASGVATNLTGTATGLTAGHVTTNANLTGDVTSVGNAATIAANAVTNAKLATMGAFTFKGNNTSGAAVPTDVDIAALTAKASPASTDLVILSDQAASGAWKKVTVSSLASAGSVASIAGNTGAFTLSTGITNVGNDIRLALNSATLQASPTNPSLANTTSVMMGMGATLHITPVYSGRMRLSIRGIVACTTATGTSTFSLRFGTGTAPANGAAPTGTQIGSTLTATSDTANSQVPFNIDGIVTGLTPGTAYWFDLTLVASAGSSAILSPSGTGEEF